MVLGCIVYDLVAMIRVFSVYGLRLVVF